MTQTTTVTGPGETVERALALSRADGLVVIAEETSSANLRWAGNALTTNGLTQGRRITVVATVGGAEGTASGVVSRSGVTVDQLEGLVRAAEAAARDAGPAEDANPLVSGDAFAAGFEDAPARTSIDVFADFAPALGEAFGRAGAADRKLYGFARHDVVSTYVGNTAGLRARHDQPTGSFELNAKSADMARSAWAGVSTRDFRDVDVAATEADVAQRLEWARRQIDLPAGRYETLLPPTAVADLMIYLYWSAGSRDAHEGRTVFSKPGGGTRVGEKLAALPLTLRSDAAYPGLECTPFSTAMASGDGSSVFDNGLALAPTSWIDEGVLRALPSNRFTAGLTGLPLAPETDNLVLENGGEGNDRSLAEMIASTERGLLLTCLWYIREVDPQTLLLTGLTRDGVYLVENGEVTGAVNNFRFNDSPVDVLGRITEAGRTERCLPREWGDYFSRAAMPAVRVPDFNMSSVSQAS
ncbi:metallopeptidase TldD-related protein [Yinghuangia seranimata]|uniref:metallopeptidase TldD-related protein n=1 Tax=Yinghuangia seranimata TaxID=408067 RepID=UPI00248BF4F1|nr:metallopeptidase TldD-related protein [Yinghuangia seranimata]MDI2126378.1 metallopeptidase TldD-related protein [Yinghuangia seranimata]